ncbi:helix-turn-helix protein [Cohnella sp. SGD-V74]|uniref:helix-turn-helix domain-containing protein n=1 Tax=unclassified Cohnella TaxID=2636738 RepID=UPI000D451038|nr:MULTISPECIES: helix-turn-helix domain-containing protein [unclassified Cohnella]PRX53411.1 helix-turn-helix protein [Cohnella sp. SGD-V74]
MSTKQEREWVIEKSEQVLERAIKQADPEFYRAFSNMLHDYILVTNPRKRVEYRKDLPELIRFIAETVDQAQPVRAYSTGELARIFGVSVQAINKWIDEGRFLGYKREGKNRHNRIPESLSFVMRTGEVLRLQEVVAMYERQQQEQQSGEGAAGNHRDTVLDEISRLMKKHGGTYEMTLGAKAERTAPEERDASIWLALLDELREINEAK